MATAHNEDLRTLAQRVADSLPAELAEEIVLTGSVSRGMADEVSDIEIVFALNRVWQPTTKRLAVACRLASGQARPAR